MLLAQINRDSQGMTEFPGGGMEAQHVTLCLTEAVTVAGEQFHLTGSWDSPAVDTGYSRAWKYFL